MMIRIYPIVGVVLALDSTVLGQVIEFAPPAYPPVLSFTFGLSVDGLGDVDGDGWGDLAVGDAGGQLINDDRVGRVYIFSGRTRSLWRTLTPPNPTDLFGVNYAHHVRSLGDIDGDGAEEIAVTASADGDPDVPFGGRVHVYSGATGAHLYSVGPVPNRQVNFGNDLARVPDADGDAIDDFVVGSYYFESRAYLFSGADGTLIRVLESWYSFGIAVGGVSDVDSDGRGEVLVADRAVDKSGVRGGIKVLSGATGELIRRIAFPASKLVGIADVDADGTPDILASDHHGPGVVALISGDTGHEIRRFSCPDDPGPGNFGVGLATVPDLDSDSFPEILVGMRGLPVNGLVGAGIAYLYSGSSGVLLRRLVSPQPQDQGNFGFSVSSVPDANADGRPELLVGAPQEWFDNGNSRGRAYLFLSCPADLNADGLATSADFFQFLTMFFSEHAGADFNRDQQITSQDFFDYLGAFFTGCE